MSRKRSSYTAGIIFTVLCILCSAYAWIPLIVENDPLIRMPGTQPAQGIVLEGPNRCLNCHADYVSGSEIEPADGWKGSMMAQAARDPIFWACLTVAAQDSVWALGNANAVDLCERCHFPGGWLGGRSDPTNASAMTGDDFDGIYCDFCHRMYDPFYQTTYNGSRESNDWTGYWNEATGFSQTSATTTYNQDRTESAAIRMFNGSDFYTKNFIPQYSTYTENGGGQYYIAADASKRASFADAQATHQMYYSRYHKSKYICSTCHDVSNPALANLDLSGLTDQSGGAHLISEQYSAFRYFHVERTFSEFMLSDYSQQGGAATNPEFAAASGGISHVAKCQDCHMFDVVGKGCDKKQGILRPDGSTEHPDGVTTDLNAGLPMHDMNGGNAWISHILASLDPAGPVYDPVNAQILNRTPAEITLDLNAGETPKSNGDLVKAGSDRARDQLRMAAVIKNLSYDPADGDLSFRVQNNTGHKLISGFPEGRRMFVSIEAYRNGSLVYSANPYDDTVGTLKGLDTVHYSPVSPALDSNEHYIDELVYEVHPKSDLTGENETFHFVLATGRYKDNRIPPKGFDIGASNQRVSTPVWHGVEDPDYFTADEYAGGYDQVDLQLPAGCEYIEVELFYQGTSREYVEFLRNEINGTADTLASPTPSGETEAYIIQTDPFFAQLRPWGNIIWDLWFHNHGLDGSGVSVDCIVPFEMAQASWGIEPTQPACDFDGLWGVDLNDYAKFSPWWMHTNCSANDDCGGADFDQSGTVDLADFQCIAEHWLWGK